MSQSKLHPEYLRQKALQDAYLVRKNKKTDFYNGIYDRWENPVLTRESIPLSWRFDLNPETNPHFMERLGVNAVFNSGAIKLNGKYYLVARIEGNDRKSFFGVAESDSPVEGFHFWEKPILLPDTCPECGSPVERDPDGAAVRCTGVECPAQRLRNLVHFASREAMDIEGLGFSLAEALVNSGMVNTPADLYRLDAQTVATLDRMGKKSAENLINEIEKSKQQDLSRLLCAFGIRQVGQKAAKVLARTFGSMDAIENATPLELTAVDDIGPITAESVVSWAQNPQTQHQIRMLREAGVNMLSREERRDNRFLGKTFVLTGTLTKYTRDEASAIVESFGGKASSSVSKKTSYVLAGEAAGSKLDKARTLGIPVITEDEFEEMIR